MRATIALLLCCSFVSMTTAQNAQPVSNPPALPAAPTIEPIALTMIRFDPTLLSVRRSDGRWFLMAGKQMLKDFGPLDREANEALRLVRDLHFTQYGMIAGSTPPFEFWLGDENEAQNGGFATKNVISFNARTLKVEQTIGAWVVRDDKLVLYNFGNDEAAARLALAVMKKHGFNQLGVIGSPRPVMTYLTVDPYARVGQPEAKSDPREALNTLSQQGLVLPGVGYVGTRVQLENRKLDIVKVQHDWTIVHGRDTLARFGMQETRARDALRLLQDMRVTEMVFVGKGGLPIFLANGKAPRSAVLGFGTARLNPSQMKVQLVNGGHGITEGTRTVMSFGENRADAELVLKVLQHFGFDQVIVVGDPERGGLRLFSRSK